MCRHSSSTDHKCNSNHRKHVSFENYYDHKKCSSSHKYSSHTHRCHWDGYTGCESYSSCGRYFGFCRFPYVLDPGPVIPTPVAVNLIQNSSMELPDFISTAPRFWTITGQGTRTGFTTLANTGQFATFLANGATLSQSVQNVIPGRQYRLSFYASYGVNQNGGRGVLGVLGVTMVVDVNVYYMQFGVPVSLFTTQVVPNANYSNIQANLPVIPAGVTSVVVQFIASSRPVVPDGLTNPGVLTDPGVLIDDVALIKTSLF